MARTVFKNEALIKKWLDRTQEYGRNHSGILKFRKNDLLITSKYSTGERLVARIMEARDKKRFIVIAPTGSYYVPYEKESKITDALKSRDILKLHLEMKDGQVIDMREQIVGLLKNIDALIAEYNKPETNTWTGSKRYYFHHIKSTWAEASKIKEALDIDVDIPTPNIEGEDWDTLNLMYTLENNNG